MKFGVGNHRWMCGPLIAWVVAAASGFSESEPSSANVDLSPLEAARVLQRARTNPFDGDYSLIFELRHMPRRGEEAKFKGQLWGKGEEAGELLYRIHLRPLGSDAEKDIAIRLLLKNRTVPEIWRIRKGGALGSPAGDLEMLSPSSMMEPVFDGLVVTPFDLQMTFLFWEQYRYDGAVRVKGRRAHQFTLFPPGESPVVTSARVFVDAAFYAPLKAELMGDSEVPIKTYKIQSFKKIQGHWILKAIDVVDERNRNKTRFQVVGAAINLDLPRESFAADALASIAPKVDLGEFDFFR